MNRSLLRFAGCATIGVLAPLAGAAEFEADVYLSGYAAVIGGSYWDDAAEDTRTLAFPTTASAFLQTPPIGDLFGAQSTSSGRAFAGIKAVGVEAYGHGETSGDQAAVGIANTSAISDVDITFYSPDVPLGTVVTVAFDVVISGDTNASIVPAEGANPEADGEILFRLLIGPNVVTELTGLYGVGPVAPTPTPLPSGTYHGQTTWINGETSLLTMSAFGYAWAGCGGPGGEATALTGYYSTFSWGGITGVTTADAGRSALTNYTFTDEFGNDWKTPYEVPAPGALALFGLFGLARRRR